MSNNQSDTLSVIGKWKYPEEKFIYEKIVLIKQTNVLGNTYFANYIEWEGEAREKFFLTHPAALEFLKTNPSIVMITHSLFHRFFANAYFGDHIRIEVTSKDILDYSLVLVFRHYKVDPDLLIGEGWQKICFSDTRSNQLCPVPQIILDLAEPIRENNNKLNSVGE